MAIQIQGKSINPVWVCTKHVWYSDPHCAFKTIHLYQPKLNPMGKKLNVTLTSIVSFIKWLNSNVLSFQVCLQMWFYSRAPSTSRWCSCPSSPNSDSIASFYLSARPWEISSFTEQSVYLVSFKCWNERISCSWSHNLNQRFLWSEYQTRFVLEWSKLFRFWMHLCRLII